MRAVIQRVNNANVCVENDKISEISKGFLVLLGVGKDDTDKDLEYLVDKIVGLRIFEDDDEKMNLSLKDVQGDLLVVSQFTLYGDCRKGKRPSFDKAAGLKLANEFYEKFVTRAKQHGLNVQTGKFQADMQVTLVNDGPVTILLDSNKEF